MARSPDAPDPDEVQDAIDEIAASLGDVEDRGTASSLTPQLEAADTGRFGIAVVTCDDDVLVAGDADVPFTIQSISKVFSLTMALEAFGGDVWKRVGREPSGDPYNSIVDLERHEGIPRNPFINAGALVVNDILLDVDASSGVPARVRDFLSGIIGEGKIGLDEEVAGSEASSGFANRALANLCKFYGNLNHPVEDVMHDYVRQCAITLSCRDLASAGRYLMVERAGNGEDEEETLRRARRVRRVNSLMLTCGQYDGSGDFAFRVGLPAKSGVGGGILAVAPNLATIAVWSPGLDANGNSLLGTTALERLSERMDWSVFGAVRRDG